MGDKEAVKAAKKQEELVFVDAQWAYLLSVPMDLRTGWRGLPGEKSIYGNINPETEWLGREDYYVGISEGTRDGRPLGSRDLDYGVFYSERVFVWGFNDDRSPMDRIRILEILTDAGVVKAARSYWDPCHVWRGFDKGKPVFFTALRAETACGPRMWEIEEALRRELPEGMFADLYAGSLAKHLYVET